MVSTWRLLPVLLPVTLIYGLTAIFLFEAARRRVRRRLAGPGSTPGDGDGSRGASGPPAWVRSTVYVLAAALVPFIVWAFIEPYRISIERVRLTSSRIKGPQPVRLVQLSDLHCDPVERLESRLPEIVLSLKPDLVVFTGDAINSWGGLPRFQSLMKRISSRCPTFAVRGNWDVWWFSERDILAGTGVTELDGNAVRFKVRDEELWLAGAAVEHEGRCRRALSQAPKDRYRVLLHHFVPLARTAAEEGADLALVGDTHGGQLWLPFLGEPVRLHRHGVWMPTGLHRIGRTWAYVSRGIGMEGGAAPRVRFLCPPEVTLFEIGPEPPPGETAR